MRADRNVRPTLKAAFSECRRVGIVRIPQIGLYNLPEKYVSTMIIGDVTMCKVESRK